MFKNSFPLGEEIISSHIDICIKSLQKKTLKETGFFPNNYFLICFSMSIAGSSSRFCSTDPCGNIQCTENITGYFVLHNSFVFVLTT